MSDNCCESVYDRGGFGSYQCIVPAKYTYNGKRYCYIHYPPNVEKRKKKANERHEAERVKWRTKWDAEERAREHAAALESACTGVAFIGDPEGAMAELVMALQKVACGDSTAPYAVSAALARVRLDGGDAEKGQG